MTTRANDMRRSLAAFDQDSTLVAVVELSKKSWLVCRSDPWRRAATEEEDGARRRRSAPPALGAGGMKP